MIRQDEIKRLLRTHHRYLQVLQEQLAMYGRAQVPPRIILEIEDTGTEIERLKAELKMLENDPATLSQRTEQQHQRIVEGFDEFHQQVTSVSLTEQKQISIIGRPPLGTVEHFKDRVREREKIGELLATPTTRLVSVIGHGGIGKTALVSKILRDLEQYRWPHTDEDIPLDGIVYLSTRTAGISLERLFLDCTKLLGGDMEKRLNMVWANPKLNINDKIAQLLDALKVGKYIVLLDNLEDLLDDGGQLVDEDLRRFFDQSLPQAHGMRLVITSRVAVTFGREVTRYDHQIKLLDGLPIAEGIELLREFDPNNDYGLQDAPEEQLAQVVKLVQGVPRALEVIAGILANDPFASLDEVMGQFYKQEDVVESLIEENYRRLDDNARRVIEALAVFRRPMLLLAVDYLLEPFVPGLDVPNIIRRLVHTNIVSVDRATKTIILHPIDQDYAYSQLLEEGKYSRPALERRAADYYVQLRTPEETWKSIDDLAPQLTEIEHRVRARDYDDACRVLNQIDYGYLLLWGHYSLLVELRENLGKHLVDQGLKSYNLGNLGLTYYFMGKVKRSIKLYEEALTLARGVGDRWGENLWLGNLGSAYRVLGQHGKAIELYEQSLAITREIGDRRSEGAWLGHLGHTYRNLGQFDIAIDFYEEALTITRETGDRSEERLHLTDLGFVYHNLGDVERAIKIYEEASVIAQEIGDSRGKGSCLGHLGIAYSDLGQFKRAIEYFEQALTIACEIGDSRGEGIRLGNLGLAYYALGQVEESLRLYKEALSIAREIGDGVEEVRQLDSLGALYLALGQTEQAIKIHDEALSIAQKIGDHKGKSHHLLGLGKANLVEKKLSEAHQYCIKAASLKIPDTDYQAELVLGIVLFKKNDSTASEAFANAIMHCNNRLQKTAALYKPRYILATALVGNAVCNPQWDEESTRSKLFTPALTEYQNALDICNAPGVIQDAFRDLELIQSAGVGGLEPVVELLGAALPKNA